MLKRSLRILFLVTILILVDVSAVQGNDLPDSAYISGVNGHPQKHPLSCEARSAADLAAYWGISLGENEFLGVLPRADNPEQGFVGSLDGHWGDIPPRGYGVHAGPVASTLERFGLKAEAPNHLKWDDLRREINDGRPVIVWIIGAMWAGTSVEYTAPDGSTSIVAAYEHTMILTGYSPDTVQVVDAYTGQYQTYALSAFLNSWAVLGNMAVFAAPAPPSQPEAPVETIPLTYTVQPGDILTAIARRYGTTWQQLAELNSLPYPYGLSVGQVLELPEGSVEVAQPDPPQATPSANVVNFEVSMPLVQHEASVQDIPPVKSSPRLAADNHPAASSDAQPTLEYCNDPGVDGSLLTNLRNMLMPMLVTIGEFFRR